METFTVYPAIDLRRGRVVRLEQGDPARETTFGSDPAATARAWLESGARWLHVVNLDGAFGEADGANLAAVEAILKAAAAYAPERRVQLGGGLRTPEDIRRAFDLGASRAILGTLAVEDQEAAREALLQYGAERIGLGIDARERQVQVRGWQESAGVEAQALGRRGYEMGFRIAVYTDVERDGLSRGANIAAAKALAEATGLQVIASGGVRSLEDVRRAREAGLSGIIIGRALYEKKIDLAEAVAC